MYSLDENTQTSYVQLKTALIDQLDPAAQENRFRTEFRARRQRHGETIAVFGRDIPTPFGAHGLSLPTPGYSGPAGA